MIFIKKYLILRHDINYVFYPYLQKKEIHSFYPKFINRIFIKIFSKLNLNFLLFGNWKKLIKEVDFIIIFDTLYQSNIAKYIKKKNKNCRIIFYYWNTISVFNQFVLNDKNIDDIQIQLCRCDNSKFNSFWIFHSFCPIIADINGK